MYLIMVAKHAFQEWKNKQINQQEPSWKKKKKLKIKQSNEWMNEMIEIKQLWHGGKYAENQRNKQ